MSERTNIITNVIGMGGSVSFETGDPVFDADNRRQALALADTAFLPLADEPALRPEGWAPEGSVGTYLSALVDWSISRGTVVDGRLVGMILLRETTPDRTLAAEDEPWTGDLSAFEGLHGVERLAIVVDAEHRGGGLGKALRDVPRRLGYDYVYGLQLKSLMNVERWISAGYDIVAETPTCWMTAQTFGEPKAIPSAGP